MPKTKIAKTEQECYAAYRTLSQLAIAVELPMFSLGNNRWAVQNPMNGKCAWLRNDGEVRRCFLTARDA